MTRLFLILFLFLNLLTNSAVARDPFEYGNSEEKPISTPTPIAKLIPTNNDPGVLYIKLQHLPQEIALKNFRGMYPDIQWLADPQEEYLIAQGNPIRLQQVQKVLKTIDQPLPQIELEAQIIEISESAMQNLGVQWKSLENGLNASDATALIQKINFLIANGQAQIKARPRLATVIHKTALIRIGDRIPYSVPILSSTGVLRYGVEYLDAGILLKILPTLAANDLITVQIHASISSLKEWKPTAAGDYPILATRESETQLHVRNGETIMLAGLLNEEERQIFEKLPILGDIPLLGELFKNNRQEKQKTDILFLITPRVVK